MNVSVIVINFNGRELTPACLESLSGPVEVFVVDNGSTDGSAEVIGARFPSVTLIRNSENRGFAAAVNQAIDRSRAPYICLLNNDARLRPDTLETLVQHLEKHSDVGIAAPQLLHEDGRRQHSFDNDPSLATVFLNKSLLRLLFPGSYPSKRQEYVEPREVPTVIGACMVVRRDVIAKIGRLDEEYFVFLEETDLCVRARQAGWRISFVPAAKVVHLQGRTRAKVATRARIEYVRSLFTFFRKHRPGSYPVVRLFYPIKNFVEWIFLTLAALLTLFLAPGVRKRWVETGALLAWQLLFCPRSFGLSPSSPPAPAGGATHG